jgi:hypothetical protein
VTFGRYYDRHGKPITLAEWASYIEGGESYRVVKRTDLQNGGRLSTVWLGLDRNLALGGGPPLIFESMLFGRDGRTWDMRRWSTEAEALEGHDAWLARLELAQDRAAAQRTKRTGAAGTGRGKPTETTKKTQGT